MIGFVKGTKKSRNLKNAQYLLEIPRKFKFETFWCFVGHYKYRLISIISPETFNGPENEIHFGVLVDLEVFSTKI